MRHCDWKLSEDVGENFDDTGRRVRQLQIETRINLSSVG
jgi:hypothetical protein